MKNTYSQTNVHQDIGTDHPVANVGGSVVNGLTEERERPSQEQGLAKVECHDSSPSGNCGQEWPLGSCKGLELQSVGGLRFH